MKIIGVIFLMLFFSASYSLAADCGHWKSNTNFKGAFDNGYKNLLTINAVYIKNDKCVVDLVYTIKPRGNFTGRNDFIYATPLNTKGEIYFHTLGRDGGWMKYTYTGPKKIKGLYISDSQRARSTLKMTSEKYILYK